MTELQPWAMFAKGPPWISAGVPSKRLHQIRAERVLKQSGHGADRFKVARRHRLVVIGVGDDHAGQARLEIGKGIRKAEHRHDLRSNRDVKAVLARDAVGFSAQPVGDIPQLAVVHVDAALPGDAPHVDIQRVALLDVIVEHGSQQVVCGADGVEVAGEMQIDILHRHDLGIAAACRAALDAEYGAERRLAQCGDRLFPEAVQRIRQPHRGGGLALARRGRGDGGDQDQPARLLPRADGERQLRLVFAVGFKAAGVNAGCGGDFGNGAQGACLRNLNVREMSHRATSFPVCRQRRRGGWAAGASALRPPARADGETGSDTARGNAGFCRAARCADRAP